VLDHFGFRVKDLGKARRFYEAVAGALGLETIDNTPTSFLVARSAEQPVPFLWIGTDQPTFWKAEHETSAAPIHLAFSSPDMASVDAFHRAALANGGTDNGAPGARGPAEMKYYGAYALDPDGNNIEAGYRGD
jgi:catechol 2,3-dioxygenase-like lactoylglutathione lyase family enzyme